MRRDVLSRDASALVAQTESAKPSPKTGEGAVCVQWVRCGKPNCSCTQGGPRHGPYYARYWWQDGRRHKRYVRRFEVADIVAACSARRESELRKRAQADETYQAWRDARALIREAERVQ